MPSIDVPQGYSYVLAAAVSTFWLNVWQMRRVGVARRKAKVEYPQMYAENADAAARPDAMAFNCMQRAHQNTMEALPHTLFAMLFTGLKFPYVAAGLGAAFTLARVVYTLGYSSADPAKRFSKGGSLALLTPVVLLLSSSYTAYLFVIEGL